MTLHEAALPLAEWEGFYVIVGTSAAALTGLMFVVIAVVADAGRRRLLGPAVLIGIHNARDTVPYLTMQRIQSEQEKPET